jgi:hypothetical protein
MSTAKEARRAHRDTNATDYTKPEHVILDLDESYRPRDLVDALQSLSFRYSSTKILRVDEPVRDYLVAAVSALSGHERK